MSTQKIFDTKFILWVLEKPSLKGTNSFTKMHLPHNVMSERISMGDEVEHGGRRFKIMLTRREKKEQIIDFVIEKKHPELIYQLEAEGWELLKN
jgi:hypothetical protein